MGLREDILEKVDVLAEYQAIGLQVAKGASPSADGWLSCHALGREDVHPSASINLGPDLGWKGIYKDFATGLAMGLFNAIRGHGNYADGNHAFYEIGRKYGVITGEKKQGRSDKGAPPTLDDVNRFKNGLSPEVFSISRASGDWLRKASPGSRSVGTRAGSGTPSRFTSRRRWASAWSTSGCTTPRRHPRP